MRKLKIGLDYHGVISRYPHYFSQFSKEVLAKGHELHIITGGPQEIIEKRLKQEHINYSFIFAILDHYASLGEVRYFSNGEFKIDDDLWNKAKAEYCLKNNIDLHIDDSFCYGLWFNTPYCFYDPHKQSGIIDSSYKIDFKQSPSQVLDVIEKFVCLNNNC